MVKQRVLITSVDDYVNNEIEDGWVVKSITPQHIAGYSSGKSGFCFLLEKEF